MRCCALANSPNGIDVMECWNEAAVLLVDGMEIPDEVSRRPGAVIPCDDPQTLMGFCNEHAYARPVKPAGA